MTQEQINKINSDPSIDSWYEGIFKEPYKIPNDVKELVVYQRYEIGGAQGGNCWGGEAVAFTNRETREFSRILDVVMLELWPDIPHLLYSKLLRMVNESTDSEWEYYGNYSDYVIRYLPVSVIEEFIKEHRKS